MRVSSSVPTRRFHRPAGEGAEAIEFAIPEQGGNSSAAEKYNFTEKAVRLSWWNADGHYDPISSAELPAWGVMDVVTACAEQDFFTAQEAEQLIQALKGSIERQSS